MKKVTDFTKTHWLKIVLPIIGGIGGIILNSATIEESNTSSDSVTNAILLPLRTDHKVDKLAKETQLAFQEAFEKDSMQLELIKEVIAFQQIQNQQNKELSENLSAVAGRIDGLVIGLQLNPIVVRSSKKDSTRPCQSISITE